MSNNHKPHYYNVSCFSSEYVENAIDLNDFIITNNKTTYNRINNPLAFLHIALFDTWLENDDRKPSNYNLIFKPIDDKYTILSIDHAFIFSTLSHRNLNPEIFSPIANEHLLVSDLGKIIKKYYPIDDSFIRQEQEYFYLCVNNCKDNFDSFTDELNKYYDFDDDSIQKIKVFLFNDDRNKKVFNEYIYRLNHV